MTNDDLIRAAFAELRAEELSRSTPPGVAAVRAAVRRRRLALTGAVGCVTAVLLLGTGYLVGARVTAPAAVSSAADVGPAPATTPAPDADRDPDPTRAPDSRLSPDSWQPLPPLTERFQELQRLAMTGLDPETEGWYAVLMFTGHGDDQYGRSYLLDQPIEMRGFLSGDVTLQVACAGSGSVTVKISVGEETATATARCATDRAGVRAGRGEVTLTAPEGVVDSTIELEEDLATDDATAWVASVGVPGWEQ